MAKNRLVTRFAPSPSGHLHIGGARTALFNWAMARQTGGQFILRVEDTDQTRSTEQSMRGIIEDLQWLGLDWDQGPDPGDPDAKQKGDAGPYFQSQRLKIYQRYVGQLLDSGHAYKCFKTPEELAAEREQARAEKRKISYDPTESRSLTPEQIARLEAEGKPCVVRFHVPGRDVTVSDAIHGEVHFQASELEDFVIQKADGFPTFHMANVVDDALMGVTLVLRGLDHLMNTAKHIAIQEALGFEHPQYAHMSLTLNPDGSKISKRDKAKAARTAAKQHLKTIDDPDAWIGDEQRQAFIDGKNNDVLTAESIAGELNIVLPEIDVRDFERSGYLSEAVVNYISLLGWSPKGDIEKFDKDFLCEHFDLAGMGKANSKFDRQKLLAFNADAIRELSPDEFGRRLFEYSGRLGAEFQDRNDPRFKLFAAAYQERARTLRDPQESGAFFFQKADEIVYDPKAVKKVLAKNEGEGLAVLRDLKQILDQCTDWEVETIAAALDSYAQKNELGMGKIAQPLRVAVTGTTVSPPIHETLKILGKDEVRARINRCLTRSN